MKVEITFGKGSADLLRNNNLDRWYFRVNITGISW
jgi:hypothetical protein